MRRTNFSARLGALLLALVLLAAPAQALTVDQARELLRENYLEPIPQEVLDKPTIPEILDALGDPYTQYLTAQEYQDFLASMEDQSLVGIGVTSTQVEEGLSISKVIGDSPALAAGLQAGDVIVAVDGVEIAGMELEQAAAMIRGEEGTKVRVTYLRNGRRRTVTITRAPVVVPNVDGSVLEGRVGYIECNAWGNDTVGHFRDLIAEMDDQVGCWLIDLRQNPGGASQAAVDAAGLFCGPGPMLSLRLRGTDPTAVDDYEYYNYDADEEAITDKPVVILVDQDTASASEAFAAALRDYDRAVIVGSRTYGKGVAQNLWDEAVLPELFQGDCMKITIARFFSPIGNTNHIIGVMPDLLVHDQELTESVAISLAQDFAETPEQWLDRFELELEDLRGDDFFPDVSQSLYPEAVNALAFHDLVGGKGDGLFHPADTLTRAELAQLLCNALNCWYVENDGTYADVAPDAWYSDAVTAITDIGLMEGTGSGVFAPDRVLSHQELITVAGRLTQWLNDDLDQEVRSVSPVSWDIWPLEEYADWAKSSAWLLSCALEDSQGGLISLLWEEYPEDIDPVAPATRDEAACLLYEILYYLDIIP